MVAFHPLSSGILLSITTMLCLSAVKPGVPGTVAGFSHAERELNGETKSTNAGKRRATAVVSGAHMRLREVYTQLNGKRGPGSSDRLTVEHPCANVVRSQALRPLARGDNSCALLRTKTTDERGEVTPCFAELWLSARKLSRTLALNSADDDTNGRIFELRGNRTTLFGSMIINLRHSHIRDNPWVMIDVTSAFHAFIKKGSDNSESSLRLCLVKKSAAPRLEVVQRQLGGGNGTAIRHKPFTVTGHYQRPRGIDQFIREHRTDHHRERRSNRMRQLIELHQLTTTEASTTDSPTTGNVTVTARPSEGNDTASNNIIQSHPCRRVPLNVSLASFGPMFARVKFPTHLELFDCVGYCDGDSSPASVHAVLMRELRKHSPSIANQHSYGCCIPMTFSEEPLVLLIVDNTGNPSVYGDLRNPQVTECGCS